MFSKKAAYKICMLLLSPYQSFLHVTLEKHINSVTFFLVKCFNHTLP